MGKNLRVLIYNFSEYIIACLFVLECRSIYNNLQSTRNYFWMFALAMLGIAVLGCVVTKKNFHKKRALKAGLLVLLAAIYYLIYFFILKYNAIVFLSYIGSVALLVVFYLICYDNQSVPTVLLKYNQLICIIAASSLFLWFFGSVCRIIPPTGRIMMNWVGTGVDAGYDSYFNLLYEIQGISNAFLPGIRFRNTAIFVEAPMYSLHLSIALMIELFLKPKASKKRVFLLVGTIITTFSVSGYLLAIIAICMSQFLTKNKTWKQVFLLISPLVILAAVVISSDMLSQKLSNLSGLTRIDDFLTGWKVFKRSPLTGVGYGNDREVQSYMSFWRMNSLGISSSLIQAICYGGLFLAVPYIVCFVRGVFSNVRICFFTLCLFFLWIITAFPFQYITSFLLIYISTQGHRKKRRVYRMFVR